MSTQLQLGEKTVHEGKDFLVIRIVERDTSLFETPDGCYILEESYVMLKSAEGADPVFVVLFSEKKSFVKPEGCTIRGMEPMPWRK